MDAVKFIQEHKRMCKSFAQNICVGCPNENERCLNNIRSIADPDEYVDYVETWAKEHPLVTNEDKFVELFGFAVMTTDEQLSEWFKREYKGAE